MRNDFLNVDAGFECGITKDDLNLFDIEIVRREVITLNALIEDEPQNTFKITIMLPSAS